MNGRQSNPDDETILRFLGDEWWLYDIEALRWRCESFDQEMEIVSDLLAEWIADCGAHDLLPIDSSIASADKVERFWSSVLDKKHTLPMHLCATRVARHLGIIVQGKVRGQWRLCEERTNPSFGLPCLFELRGKPAPFMWSPLETVWSFARKRQAGLFLKTVRQLTEHPSSER